MAFSPTAVRKFSIFSGLNKEDDVRNGISLHLPLSQLYTSNSLCRTRTWLFPQKYRANRSSKINRAMTSASATNTHSQVIAIVANEAG